MGLGKENIDFDATPREFAHQLTGLYHQEMEKLVERFYNAEYFEQVGSREKLMRDISVPAAWRELFLGTFNPARVHQLVYEKGDPYYRDRDIMIGLVKQISDETKHAKIWGQIARQFGVENSDLTTWTPEYYDSLIAQCKAAVEYDEPHFVVCALQCSTEIFPALKNKRVADYMEPEYPAIADVIRRDIVKDEGDHIHIGRKVIERFAAKDDYDQMFEIANQQYNASIKSKEGQRATHTAT